MKRVVFLIICMVILLVSTGCNNLERIARQEAKLVLEEPNVKSEINPLHDEEQYFPYFYHVNGEIKSQDAYFITMVGDYTLEDLIQVCQIIGEDCEEMHEVLFFEPNVPRIGYGDDPYASIDLPSRSYCIARFKVINDKKITVQKVDGYMDRD